MSGASLDSWQLLFFAGAGLLILVQACRGWRLGLVRQLVEIFAVVGAYASAYLIGPFFGPLLRPLGMPDQVLKALAGAAVGFFVYLFIRVFGAIIFKRTSQQSVGFIRFGFGISGALVGAVFGLFVVWVLTFAIRICGSLAESKVKMDDPSRVTGRAVYRPTLPTDPGWMRGLVHMKQAIEQGATGAMVKQMDPLPVVLYATMGRIGTMLSNQKYVERFLSYPGIQPLAEHPKMIALRDDPQIVQDVRNSNYVGLLRNPRLVQAANDAELLALLSRLDVQKALDYALSNADKP